MITVTFAGCGDAFGSGGRFQACIHLRPGAGQGPVLLDCGATSLTALRQAALDPGEIGAVFVSHLHGDHFGGLPFLILDGQFSRRTAPLLSSGRRGHGSGHRGDGVPVPRLVAGPPPVRGHRDGAATRGTQAVAGLRPGRGSEPSQRCARP